MASKTRQTEPDPAGDNVPAAPAPDTRLVIVEWRLDRLFTAPPVVMAMADLTEDQFAELLADPLRKVGLPFEP